MEDWNKKLTTAASDGDIEALKLSLQNGADIDYRDLIKFFTRPFFTPRFNSGSKTNITHEYGSTALMKAARWGGHLKYGWTALMWAACQGHLEVCQLLIDTGCKIDITEGRGWTALMSAAMGGHREICSLLIDRGCKIDITDRGGWTALMSAAMGGHLEICRLLIDTGCKINITDDNGYTALHWAAERGYLQITRYLVEQGGASLLVTTHQGETPYDLAAKEKLRQYKDVMEYLKTGVTARLKIEDNKVPTEIKLMADKRSVPLYLKLLESGSEKKRDIRLVIVGKKGAGKTSLVKRLFNEGKKGAGKTSLLKRLYNETKEGAELCWKILVGGNNEDVTSTNGIEIHMTKCKTKSSESIWNRLEGNYKETECNAILLKQFGKQLASVDSLAIIEEAAHKTITETTSSTGIDESEEPRTVSKPIKPEHPVVTQVEPPVVTQVEIPVVTHFDPPVVTQVEPSGVTQVEPPVVTQVEPPVVTQVEPPVVTQVEPPVVTHFDPPVESQVANIYFEQQQNLSLEKAHKDIKSMLEKSKVDLLDKEEYANLFLWDFAGDEEFYHTHQTFLSQDAIYLVVTKLNEADDKKAQEMFQLWMNSIHCYCRLDDQQNKPESFTAEIDGSTETQETNILDPPVILVGSHKDKVRLQKGEKIEIECKKQIQSYVKDVSDDACGHIRSEYFISNTKDPDGVFQKIKQDILNFARGMKSWNKEYPLKFIQLEKCLQERKKGLSIPIITFKELEQISLETPMPMNTEELMLFLKFHHEIRALVYFEDLPEFIVLDTQWLSDAFKCIVTAEKFQSDTSRHRMKDKLEDLNLRGILHSEVLEDVFKDEKNILNKHDRHKYAILNIMEKFDIIICVNFDGADETPYYYVPCMVKSKPECDIYEMFNVTNNTCNKSTWLCFKFRFLPPHLMNHLIASLSRKYEIAEVVVPNQKKKSVALFKGIAVFELQKKTHLRKLLVMSFPNFIQVQALEFGKDSFINNGLYKDIGDFVTEELEKIIHTRFKMSNVKFEKKFECGHTKPELVTGSNELSEEQITEYLCGTCNAPHTFDGEWSEIKSNTLSDNYEKKPGQRGVALIVNFMFHGGTNERKGSDVDCKNLTNFFKEELKYQVECTTRDMTKLELQDYFQEIVRTYLTEKAKDYHSFICVIMSHGNKNGICTTDEFITVEEIQKPFKNKDGGKFNGKPKVFLIQSCRGNEEQEKVVVSECSESYNIFPGNRKRKRSVETSVNQSGILDQPSTSSEVFSIDAHSYTSENVPIDADIIVGYATTPGYVAIRDICKGTYFIRAFLSVAKKKYKDEHIEMILRKVRNELATNAEYEYVPQSGSLAQKCQMGMLETTSTKTFFL